jgi:RNA polymerase sigma-70 factor (ECF subfamily)
LTELQENIWNRVQEGDHKAFEIIYHRFYKPMCFYANQIIKNHDLSEELVNDLFLKIWTNRKNISIKGPVNKYLFQAIHNLSLNLVKSLSTNKANVSQKISSEHWKFIEETYIINDFLLENIVVKETDRKINHAIASLPDQCREIFILSRFEGKTNQEISKLLNLTETTIRVQIFRALAKIREALENFN